MSPPFHFFRRALSATCASDDTSLHMMYCNALWLAIPKCRSAFAVAFPLQNGKNCIKDRKLSWLGRKSVNVHCLVRVNVVVDAHVKLFSIHPALDTSLLDSTLYILNSPLALSRTRIATAIARFLLDDPDRKSVV